MAKTNKSQKTKLPTVNPVKVAKSNPISTYLLQSRDEFKKIIWPTRNEAIRLTIIVLIASIIIGTILTLMDLGLAKGIDSLLKI